MIHNGTPGSPVLQSTLTVPCHTSGIRALVTWKIVPSLDVVYNAYKVLPRYETFRWSKQDGFNITLHDGAQFKAFTTQAVKDELFIKGKFRKRTWVGFVTLSRMVRVFFEYCECQNFQSLLPVKANFFLFTHRFFRA